MTNTINKVIQNGTEYLVGWVTSVNWQQWAVTVEPWITKVFTLADTSDLTTAQDAYDWYVAGGNPMVKYGAYNYSIQASTASSVLLNATYWYNNISTGTRAYIFTMTWTLSSWSVTGITTHSNSIELSSTIPTGWTTNNKITFVI